MRTIIIALVLACTSTAFAKPINVNTKARYAESFEITCHCVGNDKAVCTDLTTSGPHKGQTSSYTVDGSAICAVEKIANENLSL